jgi:hypothetical protein
MNFVEVFLPVPPFRCPPVGLVQELFRERKMKMKAKFSAVEVIDRIRELLVRAYRERPGNPIVVLSAEELKDPEVSDQVVDWRARSLAVPFEGSPNILRCTGEGYLFFRDRVAARRAIP